MLYAQCSFLVSVWYRCRFLREMQLIKQLITCIIFYYFRPPLRPMNNQKNFFVCIEHARKGLVGVGNVQSFLCLHCLRTSALQLSYLFLHFLPKQQALQLLPIDNENMIFLCEKQSPNTQVKHPLTAYNSMLSSIFLCLWKMREASNYLKIKVHFGITMYNLLLLVLQHSCHGGHCSAIVYQQHFQLNVVLIVPAYYIYQAVQSQHNSQSRVRHRQSAYWGCL